MNAATIYTRNGTLGRQGQVDDLVQIQALLQWNQPSTWVLVIPPATANASTLTSPGGGIVIVGDDGSTVLSGPVTGWKRTFKDGNDHLEVHGVDDSVWLERRLALPVPSGPPYTGSDADYRSGAAETVMRAYVSANAAETATAVRRVIGLVSGAGVVGTDLARGSAVSGVARFDVLGDLLRTLALAGGGLRFNISQSGTGLAFQVFATSDKSASIRFDPLLGNVQEFGYTVDAPKATYAIVGGSGTGTARVTGEGGDTTGLATWGRIERFVNSSKTLPADLAQDVAVELARDVQAVTLALTPIDTVGLTYGRDYNLGDIVTTYVDGAPVVGTLRQVAFSYDANGLYVTPTVNPPDGSTAGPNDPETMDMIRQLAGRVTLIERKA